MRKVSKKTTSRDRRRPAQKGAVPKTLCVADVMTREVITLGPNNSFDQAVSLMANSHFRHFVATDAAGRIAGVISDRDILRAVARVANWQTKTVSEIMTRDPVTVRPDTSIRDAVAKMLSKRIHCLPVIDNSGRIHGIVTSTDFLKSYQKLLDNAQNRK